MSFKGSLIKKNVKNNLQKKNNKDMRIACDYSNIPRVTK